MRKTRRIWFSHSELMRWCEMSVSFQIWMWVYTGFWRIYCSAPLGFITTLNLNIKKMWIVSLQTHTEEKCRAGSRQEERLIHQTVMVRVVRTHRCSASRPAPCRSPPDTCRSSCRWCWSTDLHHTDPRSESTRRCLRDTKPIRSSRLNQPLQYKPLHHQNQTHDADCPRKSY